MGWRGLEGARSVWASTAFFEVALRAGLILHTLATFFCFPLLACFGPHTHSIFGFLGAGLLWPRGLC
jgi:hypothetical protein